MDQLKRRMKKKDPGARRFEHRGSTGATRDWSASENGHYEGPLGQRGRSTVRVDERASGHTTPRFGEITVRSQWDVNN